MAVLGGPLSGTPGDDFVLGDALDLSPNGIDNYSNSGTFALKGFGGNDVLVGDLFDAISYDTEGDEIRGGGGDDIIYGDTAPDLSVLGISSQWVGDTIWDTRPEGSADQLYGEGGADLIYGCAGFDYLYGGSGNDELRGQLGTDYLYGDEGDDDIYGGADNDTSYGGAGADVISGESGNDFLYGEAFSSSSGDGGDTITGGSGNDDIRGGAGADVLSGDGGNDRIEGGGLWSNASNDKGDICLGGNGDDEISGNYGGDQITGGSGLDDLTGGDGKDVFIYLAVTDSRGAAVDYINDFNAAATDLIDLSAIDAIPGGADNDFTFRGSQPFTGAGQIRVTKDTANYLTLVRVNTDTDASAEMVIELYGLLNLDKLDFVL